jgi:hypothetical protein
MSTGTTCANECSCHDYSSTVVTLLVKAISLYGSLREYEIAESLTETDYHPESASRHRSTPHLDLGCSH